MKPCQLLEAHLDRRLDATQAATFDAHLAGCEECQKHLQAWKELEPRISGWADAKSVALRPGGEARLLARVDDEPRQPVRWPWALVAVAAAVTLGVWAMRPAPKPVPPPVAQAAPPLEWKVLEGAPARAVPEGAFATTVLDAAEVPRVVTRLREDTLVILSKGKARIARSDKARTQVALTEGRLAVEASHRAPGEALEVLAETYTVRVIGTRFLVDWKPGNPLRVSVGQGVVEVSRPGSPAVRVNAGEALRWEGERPEVTALEASALAVLDQALAASMTEPALLREGAAAPKEEPEETPLPGKRAVGPDVSRWKAMIVVGRAAEAERELAARVKARPSDFESWSLLGDARRKLRDWKGAVAAYERIALAASPAEANRARFAAATVFQDQLNEPAQAAKLLAEYVHQPGATRPLEPMALLRWARAQHQLGDDATARNTLQQVLKRHPATDSARVAQELLEAWESK